MPDGFVGQGESNNGDGQIFVLPGRAITLNVWGGWLGDFDSEVASCMAQDAADG
ncbi:MAG: hypothetical protein MO846_01115 [Candidatus Devosia symbiotica]|nr:hypothetical protein [Candidatus Devosia symbiotica]